ncbi:putative peptide ABC transporter substrate binding protein [Gemmatimonas aurantiaca T-27]|nr:putative peptide ABC transporter substrate binding protein [Gemmatimonas aurantiaca T-27]
MRAGRYALTLVVCLLAACGAPTRAPGTVVMASGSDLESGNPLVTIHPLSRQLQRHALFVTLVRLDSALQPVPYAAQRWRWDTDQQAVEFSLAPGLRWHDGVPTTAADVAFTLDAAADSALGSPRRGDVGIVRHVAVLDSLTVRVEFTAPQSVLPVVFAELPLVPRHLLDSVPRARWRGHAFATAPVGNGPFRFVSRTPGRRWEFARNTEFPTALGGPPQLQRLVVAVVDEAATKFAGLVSGEIDLAGVSPAMAHLVARDSLLTLMTPPVLFSQVLAFNTTRAPFDDARVREALSLSIDRVRLVQAAVAGYGVPAAGAIPPGLPFSSNAAAATDTAARRQQLTRADALLDASGWRRVGTGGTRQRQGSPFTITLLTVGSGDMAVEQLVQADLAERGITVNIRVMELATFLATVRAADKAGQAAYDMAVTGVPGDIALGHLSAMFASAQRGGALDYTGFHDDGLDRALASARTASAVDAAVAWRVVDSTLQASMPVAWLYHARGVQGRSRRLHHVVMDLRGELTSVTRWTRE